MTPFEVAILAALHRQPVFYEDRGDPRKEEQLQVLAHGFAEASKLSIWHGSRREAVAYLITIARYESGLSLRIQSGICKPAECDHGKAAGLFQQHETGKVDHNTWLALTGLEPDAVYKAATTALITLSGARYICGNTPAYIFANYAGVRCSAPFKGQDERVKTYNDVLKRL